MRVPVRIPVAGHNVKIEYVDELIDEKDGKPYFGETVEGDRHIKISVSRPSNAAMVWQVLLHELFHIMCEITGVDNQLVATPGLEETLAHSTDNLLGPITQLRMDIPGAKYAEVEFDFEDDE